MGYIRHHTIVVTSWDERAIEAAHTEALTIFAETACAVSEVTPVAVNGQRSFFIAPDGSKEGWTESDAGDTARAAFIVWAEREDGPYVDWAEVAFGGDDKDVMEVRGPYGGARCWEDHNGAAAASPLASKRGRDD